MGTSPAINWASHTDEAAELLCDYLRIDTLSPPGRERLACEWLGALLETRRHPVRNLRRRDDRWTLRAVLPGNGSKRPLMRLPQP